MNKRQRKKEHKKYRKELIFNKALAIMQVSIEGALNVVNDMKENGYTQNTEDLILATKIKAGVIAASPIPPFAKGGVIVDPRTTMIIPTDIDTLIKESLKMSS